MAQPDSTSNNDGTSQPTTTLSGGEAAPYFHYFFNEIAPKNDRENATLPPPARRIIPPIRPMQHISLYIPCSSGWSFFWFPSIAFQKKGNEQSRGPGAGRLRGSALAGHTFLHSLYVGISTEIFGFANPPSRFQAKKHSIAFGSLGTILSIKLFVVGLISLQKHQRQASEACLMIGVLWFYGRQLHLLLSTYLD